MSKQAEAQQFENPPPYATNQMYSDYPLDNKTNGPPPSYPLTTGAGEPYVHMQQPSSSHVVYVAGPVSPPPPNNLAYAIFVTFCCCWPIGAFAIIKALESQREYTMGNMTRAIESGEKARTLSHWALGVGIGFMLLVFVGVGLYIGLYLLPMLSN